MVRLQSKIGMAVAGAVLAATWTGTWAASPDQLQQIGVTQLRAVQPGLTGAGVTVAQVEATVNPQNPPTPAASTAYQISPTTIGLPADTTLITYLFDRATTANTFPNNVGIESWHANGVASNFFSPTTGVATNVAGVENYFADNFINITIPNMQVIASKVVNQSFVASTTTDANGQPLPPDQAIADANTFLQQYDNYVVRYGTIIVTAAGNGGQELVPNLLPAQAYNVITVGAYGGASSYGPTIDGRSKPDITAPESATSYSTPLVSGVTTLLVQAGNQNGGGAGTAAAATDARTIKALLLTGATKPDGWTHTHTAPLDVGYGAGIVNAYNSYAVLAAGQKPAAGQTLPTLGSQHEAITSATATTGSGWDYATITSDDTHDAVAHYRIDLSADVSSYVLTATLVWERGETSTPDTPLAINDLGLYLYNIDTSTLIPVDWSDSAVDNVEHLYTEGLTPGHYDLEVIKHGGAVGMTGVVTAGETYSLAYSVDVPEPGTVGLLVVGCAGLLRRRKNRA